MRKNLLEFLFGAEAAHRSGQNLGEDVVRLFEEAADEEGEQIKADKKPLAAALKSIGISATVNCEATDCEIICDNEKDYRTYLALLANADNTHKLAELGWVVAKGGDAGMSAEAPDYKIGFIELNMLEMPGNKAMVPDLDKLLKDAQKFSATKLDRDDDLNPVENDDKTSDDNQKGVGKAADGKKPEGKPKGVGEGRNSHTYSVCTKCNERYPSGTRVSARDGKTVPCHCGSMDYRHGVREKLDARALASRLLDSENLNEMTGCSAIPAVDGPPLGIAGNPADRSRLRNRKFKVNAKREPNR